MNRLLSKHSIKKYIFSFLFSAFVVAMLNCFSSVQVHADSVEGWKYNNAGWWYENADGSYPANTWRYINGAWYYFNGSGYIYENGWQYINGAWYYFYPGGAMASNCWIGNYYVNASGQWNSETWVHDNTGWWYRNSDGSYPVNTWKYINGAWYYFDNNGYIYENGWQYINGTWYYFYPGGAMASDCWIGTYYVSSSGAWIPGEKNTEGIDISVFNGDIDLNSYKNSFVMIRAGYGWTTDPGSATAAAFPQTDKQFINNVQKCEALGIPYGFYWFSYATNVDEARLEAQTFINVTNGYHPVLGYWCDQEETTWKVNNGWSWDKANDITNAFTDVLVGAGKNTGVYASYNPFKYYLKTTLPKWVAHYGNGTNGRDIDVSDVGNVKIHQYSGSGIDKDILLVPMNAIFR